MSQTEKRRLRAASPTLGPSVSPGSILLQVPGQGTLHRTNAPSPPHPLPEGPEPPRAQAWGRQVFQAPLPPHVPICPGSSACTPTRPSAPCATTWASAAPPPGPSHRPSAGHQTPSSTRAQNFHCPHPPEETALGLIGHSSPPGRSSAPASLQAPGHTLFLPPGPLPPSPQPPPASGPLQVPSPPRSSPSARSHLNVPLLTHHPSPTMPCSTGSTCRVCRGTSCAPHPQHLSQGLSHSASFLNSHGTLGAMLPQAFSPAASQPELLVAPGAGGSTSPRPEGGPCRRGSKAELPGQAAKGEEGVCGLRCRRVWLCP